MLAGEYLETVFKEYCRTYWDLVPESELVFFQKNEADRTDIAGFIARICMRHENYVGLNQDQWWALCAMRRRSWTNMTNTGHDPVSWKQYKTFDQAWPSWEYEITKAIFRYSMRSDKHAAK